MPYNTRRKSLSLSELGIAVPCKRRTTVSHPTPPATVVEGEEPPVKKSKRSHGSTSPVGSMSPPRTTTIRIKEEPRPPKPAAELSPPPSPAREGTSKIDTEGIKDDIVVGAIQQLEKTGNRPHLVKELAAVLASSLHSVEKSANPSALISSRLTAYLHRSWPAISPCPLAKDLSPVHPRRLYFYLTTQPHQPIPEVPQPVPEPKHIISPSISSASALDEEERYTRDRHALSPSPEVDLSSPELEDEEDDNQPRSPGVSFSGRNSISRDHPPTAANLAHNRRAVSPQLENEERDFKQTANALQEEALKRRSSQQDIKMESDDTEIPQDSVEHVATVSIEVEESEEAAAKRNSEDAAALFGTADHLKLPMQALEFSSPVMKPQHEMRVETTTTPAETQESTSVDHMSLDVPTAATDSGFSIDDSFTWDTLRSPENVELDELETMFDAY